MSIAFDNKQDILNQSQLSAVDSGITSAKVEQYDSYQQQIDAKITIDDHISSILAQSDLSVIKLSSDEFECIVSSNQEISNCLYIVNRQYINAYGEQIKNIASGTDLSDAVTLNQMTNAIAELSTEEIIRKDNNDNLNLSLSNGLSGFYINNDNFIQCVLSAIQMMNEDQISALKDKLGLNAL